MRVIANIPKDPNMGKLIVICKHFKVCLTTIYLLVFLLCLSGRGGVALAPAQNPEYGLLV